MTLENKLGLTNSAELAREEERISKKKLWSFLKRENLISWNQVDIHHLRLYINFFLKTYMTLQERPGL